MSTTSAPIPFRAETRQLLNILIHSLYSEREVFLRELISNASDALTRLQFEMLTNHDVLDPDEELAIRISVDTENNTLTISDSGIGMTREEMIENLGTIAHSGARAFIEAASDGTRKMSDIIGQFGVGFYSAFMVAEKIEVSSRTFTKDGHGVRWISSGEETYQIEDEEKTKRGTTVTVHLKEDAKEFCQESTLRRIIKTHSDYIPFPIYLGDASEQINQQNAIWRQMPHQVKEEDYQNFFRQFTLIGDNPLLKLHLAVDAPVQMYSLLFVPEDPEKTIFSLRKEDGIKLYARKVLIQEYCKDLLPSYFRFVDGVVDSEDLPLNISRESIQSNRVMLQLKKVITNKLVEAFKNLAKEKPEEYAHFWKVYGRAIREGVASDPEMQDALIPLLRFHSLSSLDDWMALDDYILKMPASQKKIYYLLGDDELVLSNHPNVEWFKKNNVDVLLLADPLDPFVLLRLTQYKDFDLANAAVEDLPTSSGESTDKSPDSEDAQQHEPLLKRFKATLGDRVADVRLTERLIDSPARLVDKEGGMTQEVQRVYRLLNKEFDTPEKILEINANHPILRGIADLDEQDEINKILIEQIYEDALLVEGLHPNPAGMVQRIQQLMARLIAK